MAFDQNLNGLFRANENAAGPNAVRLVDPTTPGTPEIDTLTVDTSALTGVEVATGIQYTGKDGTTVIINFSDHTYPEGGRREKSFVLDFIDAAGATTTTVQLAKAIAQLIELHEVDPEVKAVYTGDPTDELVLTHTGSGTFDGLVIDGSVSGSASRDPI